MFTVELLTALITLPLRLTVFPVAFLITLYPELTELVASAE
jgi:hypothetical protein